jgi:hypothetical protein
MRDPVTRLGVPETEPPAGRAQEAQEEMVVLVLTVSLEQVVVCVLHRDLGLHAVQPKRFQLQHDQRPGRVLGQRLGDRQRDLGARPHLAPDQVGRDKPRYSPSASRCSAAPFR